MVEKTKTVEFGEQLVTDSSAKMSLTPDQLS